MKYIIISEDDGNIFEKKINDLSRKGYIIISSSCGWSENYDCNFYMAIMEFQRWKNEM